MLTASSLSIVSGWFLVPAKPRKSRQGSARARRTTAANASPPIAPIGVPRAIKVSVLPW